MADQGLSIPIDFSKNYEWSTPDAVSAPEGSVPIDFNKGYEFTPPEPPKPPESLLSSMVRGGVEAAKGIPQLGWGLVAGGAAAGESMAGEGGLLTGVKNYAAGKYGEWEKDISKDSRPEDSFNYSYEKAKEGDIGALMSWGAHGIGYVGAQAITMLTGVGIGEKAAEVALKTSVQKVLSGMVAKEASRLAEKSLVEEGLSVTAEAIARRAAEETVVNAAAAATAKSLGQHAGAAAFGYGMEGGEIGGDLAKQSVDENRALSGEEVFRGISGTLLAGTVEYAENMLGIAAIKGKLPMFKSVEEMGGKTGRLARGAVGTAEVAPIEAGQEYIQTGIEQWAKGQDLSTPEAAIERSDSAWLGSLGGSLGGVGGVLSGPKKSAPPVIPGNQDLHPSTPDLTQDHTVSDVLATHRENLTANTVAGVLNQPESPNAVDIIPSTDNPYQRIEVPLEQQAPSAAIEQPAIEQPNMKDVKRLGPHLREMLDSLGAKKADGSADNPDFVKKATLNQWQKETGEDLSHVGSGPARETLEAIRTLQPLNEKQAKVWSYLRSVAENKAMQAEQATLAGGTGIPAITSINVPADRSAGELPADFGGASVEPIIPTIEPTVEPIAPTTKSKLSEEVARLKAKKEEASQPAADDERFTDMVKVLNNQTSAADLEASYQDMSGIFKARPELAPYQERFAAARDAAAEKLKGAKNETTIPGETGGTLSQNDGAGGQGIKTTYSTLAADQGADDNLQAPGEVRDNHEVISAGSEENNRRDSTAVNIPATPEMKESPAQPSTSTREEAYGQEATQEGTKTAEVLSGTKDSKETLGTPADVLRSTSQAETGAVDGGAGVSLPDTKGERTAATIKAEIETLQNKEGKSGADLNKINDLQFELYDVENGTVYPEPENAEVGPLREKKRYIEARNERLNKKLSKMSSLVPPPIKAEVLREIEKNADQIEQIDKEIESYSAQPKQANNTPDATTTETGTPGSVSAPSGVTDKSPDASSDTVTQPTPESTLSGDALPPQSPLKLEVEKAKAKGKPNEANDGNVTGREDNSNEPGVAGSASTGSNQPAQDKADAGKTNRSNTDTTLESLQADLAATDAEIEELYKLRTCLEGKK